MNERLGMGRPAMQTDAQVIAELEAEVTRLRGALEEMTAYASSPENPLWDAGWQMGHRRGQAEKRAAEQARNEALAALREIVRHGDGAPDDYAHEIARAAINRAAERSALIELEE